MYYVSPVKLSNQGRLPSPSMPPPVAATATGPDNGQRPLARRALYEEVAEQLRQRIFARQLEPGAWIDELKIAAEMGISRTPLREALKVLAVETASSAS
jgi:AraC-like DNA-binding protein